MLHPVDDAPDGEPVDHDGRDREADRVEELAERGTRARHRAEVPGGRLGQDEAAERHGGDDHARTGKDQAGKEAQEAGGAVGRRQQHEPRSRDDAADQDGCPAGQPLGHEPAGHQARHDAGNQQRQLPDGDLGGRQPVDVLPQVGHLQERHGGAEGVDEPGTQGGQEDGRAEEPHRIEVALVPGLPDEERPEQQGAEHQRHERLGAGQAVGELAGRVQDEDDAGHEEALARQVQLVARDPVDRGEEHWGDDQAHHAHGRDQQECHPPVGARQVATDEREHHGARHDDGREHAHGARHPLLGHDRVHVAERGAVDGAEPDAGDRHSQHVEDRRRCGHHRQVADRPDDQGHHQDIAPAQAVGEEARRDHGGGDGQGLDAGRQRLGAPGHVERPAGTHQRRRGDVRA